MNLYEIFIQFISVLYELLLLRVLVICVSFILHFIDFCISYALLSYYTTYNYTGLKLEFYDRFVKKFERLLNAVLTSSLKLM